MRSYTAPDGSKIEVSPGGFGWWDVCVRNPDGEAIASVELHAEDIRELFEQL